MKFNGHSRGVYSALISAVSMGCLPILGKQALLFGFTPLAVVALRTSIAVLLLFCIMLLFKRQFFYIYPVGLAGCILAGFVNGIGSIFYYSALQYLSASIGHMLYSFYPVFMALWLLLDRQSISRVTILRLTVSVLGAYFLIVGMDAASQQTQVNLVAAGLMMVSALLYALHLMINQRILYDVPAPTVTLYTLLSMSVTVVAAFLIFRPQLPAISAPWLPLLIMGFITFVSRLALFAGVKKLGGLQTAILGLAEIFITIILAQTWLHERLGPQQWIGAALLGLSLILVRFEQILPDKRRTTGWLSWLNPPRMASSDIPNEISG